MDENKITVDELNNTIVKLTETSNEIKKSWNKIKKDEMDKLKIAWLGKDSTAYISKIMELDIEMEKALKIQKTIEDSLNKTKEAMINIPNKEESI